ncbi:hypothetical protein LIER_01891 [Lithospermum erythrorhizon]
MTLKVHYGGIFTLNHLRVYENGQLRTIDFVSMDTFNLLDIDVIVVAAGYKYKFPVMYLWLVLGETLDNGLRPFQCTEHILQLFEHASYWKTMDIYLDRTPL